MWKFLLPCQQGSVGVQFEWYHCISWALKPQLWYKNMALISYTCGVIANFVLKYPNVDCRSRKPLWYPKSGNYLLGNRVGQYSSEVFGENSFRYCSLSPSNLVRKKQMIIFCYRGYGGLSQASCNDTINPETSLRCPKSRNYFLWKSSVVKVVLPYC